jgi:hypothetical protein
MSGARAGGILREVLVVDNAVLTDAELNDAITISQSSPGPLGLPSTGRAPASLRRRVG